MFTVRERKRSDRVFTVRERKRSDRVFTVRESGSVKQMWRLSYRMIVRADRGYEGVKEGVWNTQ